jgi:branched-chain amino acid transport system substrate-binding protein
MSLTLAGALVLTACGGGGDDSSGSATGGGEASGEDLTIGVLLPLTGPLSPLGKEMLNGYEAARKAINDAGGIDGRPVVYEISDAPTPEAATSVAGTLSADPDVSLIMGSYSSSIAIPASAVSSRNQKLYWETGGISAEITGRDLDYIYRTVVSTSLPVYQNAVADFVSDIAAPALGTEGGDLRFGLTYTDDAFGTAASAAFKALAEKNKFNIVAEESYAASASDLSSVVEQLKSADVDVLYAIGGITDAILLVRQSEELGFDPDLIIGNGAGFSDKGFVGGAGDAANGVVVSDAVPLHISDDLLSEDVSPSYSEFTEAFEEEIGYEPLTHATLGYAGAMVLFQEVLPNADLADIQSLVEAVEAVDIEPGGTVAGFGVKFDETGQNERAGWYFMQYQNDELVAVAPDEFAASELLIGE